MTYFSARDHRLIRAIANIKAQYGDDVSVEEKNKGLIKFGRNDNLGTTLATIWQIGGNETYPTGNDIDIVTSDNAGDTQEVIIEGHTMSSGNLTFVSQTATLNGTSNVTLTTPLFRANRLINNGTADFNGTVTVEDSGAATTHLQTSGTNNQSLKAATSLSQFDYWILTGLKVGVNRQQTRSVDFRLQVREYGKVFRGIYPIAASSNSGAVYVPFDPYLIIPPNSDIRVVGVSSNTGTGAEAAIHGHLAIIT